MHVIKKWHELVETGNKDIYDEILADDVVFYSPVVHTPQKGKEITKIYLSAAGNVFEPQATLANMPKSKFRYSKEIMSGNQAVLEFESEVDGKYVNGVDILTWNDAGKIVEFKVMIRPLQAVNAMHQQMGEMLEKMKG